MTAKKPPPPQAPATHYPLSQQQEALRLLAAGLSVRTVCAQFGMHPTTLCTWRRRVDSPLGGRAAHRIIPLAHKQQAARDLLAGRLSEADALRKYGVREKKTLRQWVAAYQLTEAANCAEVVPPPLETPPDLTPSELLAQLHQAQWQLEALHTLIDQAEATYHIAIRKKAGAKPST